MSNRVKASKADIDGNDLFVGDNVKIDEEVFQVKYGNYIFLGVDRVGFYMEAKERIMNNQLPLNNQVKKIK